jgi:hypothetical protein
LAWATFWLKEKFHREFRAFSDLLSYVEGISTISLLALEGRARPCTGKSAQKLLKPSASLARCQPDEHRPPPQSHSQFHSNHTGPQSKLQIAEAQVGFSLTSWRIEWKGP